MTNDKKDDDDGNGESQRNNGITVYMRPALRQWVINHGKENDESLSKVIKRVLIQYAKEQGFKEDDYLKPIKPTEPTSDSEASAVARQLADLASTIERLLNNAKCIAMYI
ncbi:MAG: hypothetical protein DRQ99_24315 [Candidatus Parabeggiatoa sp. nov. 3]|jgi:type VI protein secretion system component VasK|nr:MAG: hypothetical protein DRQ99_24315 [Gammaproteobacteria bacterium]